MSRKCVESKKDEPNQLNVHIVCGRVCSRDFMFSEKNVCLLFTYSFTQIFILNYL